MKTTLKRNAMLASAISLALISTQAAALDFGADIELDTNAIDTTGDMQFSQGGRVAVNAMGKKSLGGAYVEGKGSVLATTAGDAAIDDAWVKFGTDAWSLQAGRFEAVNLFPLGKDTLVVTAGDGSANPYFANLGRGRIGSDAGQFALVYNLTSALKVELDTVWGSTDGDDQTAASVLRPSITYSTGAFSLTAGMERLAHTIPEMQDDPDTVSTVETTPETDVDITGYALTGSFNVGGAAVNVNFATQDDSENDTSVTSYGANVIYSNFGLGVIQTTADNGSGTDPESTSIYAAYTMPLMGIDGASLTLAASSSTADNAGSNDSATGFRARINYGF